MVLVTVDGAGLDDTVLDEGRPRVIAQAAPLPRGTDDSGLPGIVEDTADVGLVHLGPLLDLGHEAARMLLDVVDHSPGTVGSPMPVQLLILGASQHARSTWGWLMCRLGRLDLGRDAGRALRHVGLARLQSLAGLLSHLGRSDEDDRSVGLGRVGHRLLSVAGLVTHLIGW